MPRAADSRVPATTATSRGAIHSVCMAERRWISLVPPSESGVESGVEVWPDFGVCVCSSYR